MGGISITHSDPEQVLVGDHEGVDIIVFGVKPGAESATACWDAALGLLKVLQDAGSEQTALIVDIPNASVRHGFVTRMS